MTRHTVGRTIATQGPNAIKTHEELLYRATFDVTVPYVTVCNKFYELDSQTNLQLLVHKPKKMTNDITDSLINRIVGALERMAPPSKTQTDLSKADAFVWDAENGSLEPVMLVNKIALSLLMGIDQQRDILLENTLRFAKGLPSNNALLWGARGSGKSSLVKAIHASINEETPHTLALVELHREDIPTLPSLLAMLRGKERRVILYCDDLSFTEEDTQYKSLKAVLEGGIEGRPRNVIFYATSNRRHLMPRDMIENERSTAINPSESVEEKVSLSDRFGLWLGFHACDQDTFFAMIEGYIKFFNLQASRDQWESDAIEWSVTRGARSGRVAWQFIQDLAGRLGQSLD